MPRLFGVTGVFLGAAALAAPDEPGGSGVQAWVRAEPAGSGQAFTAFVRTEAPFDGRYELTAERNGPAGRSTSRQAGSIQAKAGDAVQLSRTALSPLGAGDGYRVVLSIYRGDELVARDEKRR
ncbi:MAG: hypothetical protein KY446_02175 [Proteobacteria bacterium]|nr:hypothetical protein [Pseudomonadota bacterium]